MFFAVVCIHVHCQEAAEQKKKSDWISLREGNDANMDKCPGINGLEGSNDIFIALVYFSITRHFYVKKKID